MLDLPRVVITGVGLTSPNGNTLAEYRSNLLRGVSGVREYEIRHVGKTLAGVCDFDPLKYQKRKELRRGTRAGSVSIWCANEALRDAGFDLGSIDSARVGIYTGITEHGNVETENEIHDVARYDFDLRYWSHHHNPRTVANNPAGEATLNLGAHGPAYSLGGACAAGNLGLIHGMQMLQLGEVDLALAGGVSESIHTFGIFASFASQGALAQHADPAQAHRAPSTATATASSWPRAAACTRSNASRTPRPAARTSYARSIGHSIGLRRHRLRAAGCRRTERLHPRRARLAPGSSPERSTSSRPTPRRLPRGTRWRRARCARSSATAKMYGSTTQRATSVTPWAPPPRSSWPATCPPSRTAPCTPRSTSRTSTPPAKSGTWSRTSAPGRSRRHDPQHVLRHAGHQLGRHRQEFRAERTRAPHNPFPRP